MLLELCDRICMMTIGSLLAAAVLQCVSCIHRDVCSSTYSLSTDYLGFIYEVLAWPPSGKADSEVSFSVVASELTSTDVRVRFPPVTGDCVIMLGPFPLDCGQTVDFTLFGVDIATFTSTTTDLSGTLVKASMPVAVYANNSRVTIGLSDVRGSTSEQLLPMSTWGRQFVVAPVPDNSHSGYSLRVSCGNASNIAVDVDGVAHQLLSQNPLTVDFPDNRPTYVNVVDGSRTAVQVVQFVRGATVATDSGAPAALVVPPIQMFSNVYNLTVVHGCTQYVSIVSHRSDISGLQLNNHQLGLSDSVWLNVDSSSDWVSAAVQLPTSGFYRLEHTGQRQFGAYIYGYIRGHCAFAHVAGASLPHQVIY